MSQALQVMKERPRVGKSHGECHTMKQGVQGIHWARPPLEVGAFPGRLVASLTGDVGPNES